MRNEVTALCKSLSFWVFDDNANKLFKEIDASGDGRLSIDEVHRWYVRNKLNGIDMNMIRKYRAILKIGINEIDKNNDGYVNENEFADLYK